MPFQILRNDIVHMQVDAIVNTANPDPVVGSGTDSGIHAKAGPRLLEARKAIGRIPRGQSAITPAFSLHARYVIHTVGPVWRGGLWGEEKLLRSCYRTALQLALAHGCRSIAFPLISTGNYGYPRDKALRTAICVFSEFLTEQDMDIYLVVLDDRSFRLSEKLFRDVASYIDQHYAEEVLREEQAAVLPPNGLPRRAEPEEFRIPQYRDSYAPRPVEPKRRTFGRARSAKSLSLEEMLRATDAGFSETLLKLIDKSGKKDSEIYNRANISRQHFSKIRNNPLYKPTKPTALAFAIALELDMDRTKDLIGRAGYALTYSSKFDVILMYFIENRIYDLDRINQTLYEFDQPLLGI